MPSGGGIHPIKVLVLQALYGLADEQAEFQLRDRLSLMRFLGLDLHGRVPDARTIWLFRETLTKAGAIDTLFARFDAHLRAAGYLAMGGQMIDASLIEAPRRRNTEAEKEDLKAGRIPEDWAKRPAKLRQKDQDGRWTLVTGQGAAARGRHQARRHCHPGLRLQVSHQHRPPTRLHPEVGRDGRQPA